MPWKNIVKSPHRCQVPNATEISISDAQTGSVFECWCGQLWQLHRGNFKNKWTAVEEES